MTYSRIRYAGLAVVAMTFAASPALAQAQASAGQSTSLQLAQQSYVSVIGNLETTGYAVVELETTLLGRVRIVAQNSVHVREVVVSRSTGEVMSDRIVRVLSETGGATAEARAAGAAAADAGSSGQSGASVSVEGSVTGGGASGTLSGDADVSVGAGSGDSGGSASGGGSLGGSVGF